VSHFLWHCHTKNAAYEAWISLFHCFLCLCLYGLHHASYGEPLIFKFSFRLGRESKLPSLKHILEVPLKNQHTHDSERQDSTQAKCNESFEWTAYSVANADPRSQMPQMGADVTAWRVLLIDDNQMVRELIKLQLEQLGYHVLCAKDGKEAL
jgi:hypothetical protein